MVLHKVWCLLKQNGLNFEKTYNNNKSRTLSLVYFCIFWFSFFVLSFGANLPFSKLMALWMCLDSFLQKKFPLYPADLSPRCSDELCLNLHHGSEITNTSIWFLKTLLTPKLLWVFVLLYNQLRHELWENTGMHETRGTWWGLWFWDVAFMDLKYGLGFTAIPPDLIVELCTFLLKDLNGTTAKKEL